MRKSNGVKTFTRILSLAIFLSIFITYLIITYIPGFHFKQSPAPTVTVSFIGCLMTLQLMLADTIPMTFNWNIKKTLFVAVAIELVCTLILTICYGILKDFVAMATVLLWIIPFSLLFYTLKKQRKLERIDGGSKISLIEIDQSVTFDVENKRSVVEPPYDTSTCKGKFKCCCIWFLVVFLGILLILVSIVASISTYYRNQYKPIGKIVNAKAYPIDQPKGTTFLVHLNCFGKRQSNKPIFIFEHGAGSNDLAWAEIQQFLNQSNMRSCSYDRSGFGRSQSGPNDNTPHDVVQRLYSILQENNQIGPYIMVGWSAGVEIIQVFHYFHQNQIVGMVYIDGYPDYKYLEAINYNKSVSWIDSQHRTVKLMLDFLRWMQPLGLGFLVGQSQEYKPESMISYYTAYNRNYKFWNSQYIDFSNSNQFTSFLTQLAKQEDSSVPYTSDIPLNWPEIESPLLIIASGNTVQNKNESNIYYKQCLKYLQKATDGRLQVVDGNHDMVYAKPIQIFKLLRQFYDKITTK